MCGITALLVTKKNVKSEYDAINKEINEIKREIIRINLPNWTDERIMGDLGCGDNQTTNKCREANAAIDSGPEEIINLYMKYNSSEIMTNEKYLPKDKNYDRIINLRERHYNLKPQLSELTKKMNKYKIRLRAATSEINERMDIEDDIYA